MNISRDHKNPTNVYGPVPSRRLGFSLGVDICPFKTCSFDCIYCQLGSSPQKDIKRKRYFKAKDILEQIRAAIKSGQQIDYITFSGSGEPALNTLIGLLIRKVKKNTATPVAVLTNSSLFTRKDVRKALLAADVVIPSLDAATQGAFINVNRPHPSLNIKTIIQSLKQFRKEFNGNLWLEIMLVKGVNDSPSHIRRLKEAALAINPDKIQLNTVIRPPAESHAQPLSKEELFRIKNEIGEKAEIIAEFKDKKQCPSGQDIEETIFSVILRRPVTVNEIAALLGKHHDEVLKHVNNLLQKNKIKQISHKGTHYFEAK